MNELYRNRDRLWIRLLVPVASLAVVILLWLAMVHVFNIASYVLPSPSQTFQSIHDDWDVLWPGLRVTAKEFVLGFLFGTAAGFGLALAMAQSRWVQRSLYPLLIATQAIPIIAIGAALVIWLGFGLAPKVLIVALIVFFPVLVNVLDGLATVDRDTVNLARAMGAGPWRVFRVVRLPATYSPMFSALKMSATFSVTGAVIGEQTASSTGGLGVYLTEQQSRLNTAGVFGDIVLLAAMGVTAFALIALWESFSTPWRRRSTAPRRHRFSLAEGTKADTVPGPVPPPPGPTAEPSPASESLLRA